MKWHQRFFWILLALLPTQLGVHFWPEWAGVLGRRVDYLAPTIYLTDFLIFATLTFWFLDTRKSIKELVFSILGKQIQPKVNVFSYILYTKPYILTAVFVALNIFFATSRPVAAYKWLKVSEFVLLGWYIVKTKPALSMIITPLSIGVFYSSVLAIAQFFLQHSVGGPLWWLGERTFSVDTPGIARIALNWSLGFGHWDFGLKLRPYGTFPHPNVLGGYIAAILPLAIIQLSNNPIIKLSNSKKIFYLMTIVFGIIALLLTFSRSAVAVGMIGIGMSIWYLVFRKKTHRVITYILYTIPFILFAVAVAWSFSPKEESVVVRKELNASAVTLWRSSPLFGVGLGNFLVRLPKALPTRTIYFLQPVHNIYLLLLSEVGIVGVGIIITLVWESIKGLVYSIKEKTKGASSNLNTIYLIPLTCILLLGVVDHYPFTLQQGQIMLTLLLGLVVSMSKSDQSGPIRPMND